MACVCCGLLHVSSNNAVYPFNRVSEEPAMRSGPARSIAGPDREQMSERGVMN